MPKLEKVSRKPSWEKFGKLKKTFGPRKPSAPLGPSCNVSLCLECKIPKNVERGVKKNQFETWKKRRSGEAWKHWRKQNKLKGSVLWVNPVGNKTSPSHSHCLLQPKKLVILDQTQTRHHLVPVHWTLWRTYYPSNSENLLNLGIKCWNSGLNAWWVQESFIVAIIHRATLVEGSWRKKKGKMKLRSSQTWCLIWVSVRVLSPMNDQTHFMFSLLCKYLWYMINIHISNCAAIDYNRVVVPKARNAQFKSVTYLVSKRDAQSHMVMNNSHQTWVSCLEEASGRG